MADMKVRKGDFGYYLNFTIQDSGETAYSLTGYTIKLKVWRPNKPSALLTNGSCDIVVAASGTCKYLVTASDFTAPGLFNMELELTKADVEESTRTYTILVEESP